MVPESKRSFKSSQIIFRRLFPGLVAPALESPGHGLWLLPTPEFGRRGVRGRGPAQATDAQQSRRYRRDVLLTEIHRRQAAAHGLRVAVVDGPVTAAGIQAHRVAECVSHMLRLCYTHQARRR